MADAVNPSALASYPGNPTSGASSDTVALVIRLTNGLVADVTGPLDSVPSRVEAIALEVAARALRNPESASEVRLDDYSVKRPIGQESAGVYLTRWERGELAVAVAEVAGLRPAYVVPLWGDS